MPFPNKPFKDWNKDDLDYLLADPPAVENSRRDFKADCKVLSEDKKEKEKARKDILKDICTMANAAGGALLIGVRQSGKKGSPPFAERIEGIKDDPEQLKQAIEGLVNTPHLDVRPGPLEYHPIQDKEGRTVLIVEVPANTYSLSMVTYEDLNQFWVRRGTDNCLMTTDEIEYRFAQFAKIHESASEELGKIIFDFHKTLTSPMVWFAGVPITRARDHVPVDIQRMKGILENSSYYFKYSDRKRNSGFTPDSCSNQLTPSLRGIGLHRDYQGQALLEIRRDGIVTFGVKLPAGPPTNAIHKDSQACTTVALWWIYEPLISALHLFSDIQKKFELARISVVQAGLIGVENIFLDVGGFFKSMYAPKFPKGEIVLDGKLLNEQWIPSDVFDGWALQLANALGHEQPFVCPPWIDVKEKRSDIGLGSLSPRQSAPNSRQSGLAGQP